MGFGHIQEAENVLQAQAFLEKTSFDLIVCDWNMPDKPGFELLKTLRAKPDGANVPFLFLTGRPKEEIMVQSRKYGATDVLAKPFSPDTLKTIIAAMFDGNG
jgi:DNA-binding response OmpR family regulator